MTCVNAFLARFRRTLRSDDGFTLVELIIAMAMMLTVFAAITGAFASGLHASTATEQITQAQLDARQALTRMREDLNCAYAVQAVGPRNPASDSGFYLYLTEQYNTCQTVDSSAGSGGSKVFLSWCTIPVAGQPGVYSLYRENLLGSGTPSSTCDSSGTLEATDLVAPAAGWPTNAAAATPSTWNGNIWPSSAITCTSTQTNYLPTVGVDMAVNPAPVTNPGATYELKDQLTLRNGTRCGTAGSGGATGTMFSISAPTPSAPTAGSSFTVTLTAQLVGGGTDTTYGGTRTITFSGAPSSPSGSAPVYPANVIFTNGVGTATITVYDAASTTLSATDGTKTGSSTFTVGAGTPAALDWSGASVSKGTLSSNCTTTCTWTGGGKKGTFTATVKAFDAFGNPISNIGTKSVTYSATTNNWNSSTLSFPVSGTATTASNSWQAPNNTTWTSTLTASSTGLSSVTVTSSGS
jgi:prepilin-type N-terminal cleavage/methylation domain-containing protein